MLMVFVVRSFKMVVVSLIPNLLPLMITAGLMGYFGIPKTIHNIGFSIALDFQSMIPSIS
jgi:predicted RND superfamily exporter protein